jgi:transcriptional regulator with XRE-family HTH domain
MSMKKKIEPIKEFDREMLRSTFVSIFWAAITEKRKTQKLTLQSIAKDLGTNKSAISRWFSGELPNWTSDTVADIARVLDIELRVFGIDRSTGAVFQPYGMIKPKLGLVQDSPIQTNPGQVQKIA